MAPRGHPLDDGLILEVIRLLEQERLSKREVSRRLAGRVSRSSIQNIAAGRYRLRTAVRCPSCRTLNYGPCPKGCVASPAPQPPQPVQEPPHA
jgi:hypothetical protein